MLLVMNGLLVADGAEEIARRQPDHLLFPLRPVEGAGQGELVLESLAVAGAAESRTRERQASS